MLNTLSQHIGKDIARLIYYKYLDRVDRCCCYYIYLSFNENLSTKIKRLFNKKLPINIPIPKSLLFEMCTKKYFNLLKWTIFNTRYFIKHNQPAYFTKPLEKQSHLILIDNIKKKIIILTIETIIETEESKIVSIHGKQFTIRLGQLQQFQSDLDDIYYYYEWWCKGSWWFDCLIEM